jgi:hypothetical protein
VPRVRILQAVAGEAFSWAAGDEVDMSAEDAAKWADGNRGELVRGGSTETPEDGAKAAETTSERPRPARPRVKKQQ